jgi:acetyltransferase
MSVRNLDALFKPTSIALVGASRKPRSIGQVVARNLLNAGFDGPVMPVNRHERSIEGVFCYNDVADLPVTPDLAVIATPPDTVPALVDQLGRRGTRGIVVITAGFGEGGEGEGTAHGRELRKRLLEAARPFGTRIVGPNCLGLMVPGRGVNASFVHVPPRTGDIAFLAQSGAVLTSVVDWADARGIGFSHLVSLGDMADVDFGDLLDHLATDSQVRAILLYVEAITSARKFMSAARAAARAKPVIVIKAGRTAEAAKAASSHTGALAGTDAVYDAAFRRAGMLRVDDLDALFDAVETLATGVQIKGDRLAILTNGGGIGVLATDTLIGAGGRLASLTPDTIAKLDAVLPPTWSRGNPVDIIGDAPGKRYAEALATLMGEPGADAILVLNCPTAVADGADAAQAVITTLEAVPKYGRKPVLTSWLGEGAAAEARRLFGRHRIPTHETPDKAVRAFMHLVDFRRNQEMLMETPASVETEVEGDTEAARAIIGAVRGRGQAGAARLWHPGGGDRAGDHARRGGGGGRTHRPAGRAQDPVARHHPQVGRGRRGAASGGGGQGAPGGGADAAPGGGHQARRAARRLHRPGDGGEARRARADRRHDRGRAVRPRAAVRPGRHGGGGAAGQGAGPAAAQHEPRAADDRRDAGRAPPERLSLPPGGEDGRHRADADAALAAGVRPAGGGGAGHQPAVRRP